MRGFYLFTKTFEVSISCLWRLLSRCFISVLIAVLLTACNEQNVRDNQSFDIMSFYTEQDIADVIEISASEIERQTGREFESLPSVDFVSVTELTAIILEDRGQKEADSELKHYVRSVDAIYKNNRKAIYIIPENFSIRSSNLNAGRQEAYNRLLVTMTHELVHALQYKETEFDYTSALYATNDSRRALRMTIEGHAELVTGLVLQQMGLISDIDDYQASDRQEDTNTLSPQEEYEQELSEIYIVGLNFFAYQYKLGGEERIWNILKNPPTQTNIMKEPEKFQFF